MLYGANYICLETVLKLTVTFNYKMFPWKHCPDFKLYFVLKYLILLRIRNHRQSTAQGNLEIVASVATKN